jgi:hypothetical protein
MAGAILLPFVLFIAWSEWRARKLLAFCKELQPGVTVTALLALEKRRGIDESYLTQALDPDFVDQAHSRSLAFQSQMLDPDFACLVEHDGESVISVEVIP